MKRYAATIEKYNRYLPAIVVTYKFKAESDVVALKKVIEYIGIDITDYSDIDRDNIDDLKNVLEEVDISGFDFARKIINFDTKEVIFEMDVDDAVDEDVEEGFDE